MAKEYKLTINVEGLTGGTSKARSKLNRATGKGPGNFQKGAQNLQKGLNAIKGFVAVEAVNTIAIPTIEYQINSYSARFGNSARANTVKNIARQVGKVGELGSSVLAGAAIGGIPGAIIAGVLDAAKQTMDINHNLIDYQTKQDKYKFTEIRASERLGLTLSDRNRNNF